MNLLENESKKNEEQVKKKKLIRNLLIISIVALVVVMILMETLNDTTPKHKGDDLSIIIDEKPTEIKVIKDENEIKFVAIEDIVSSIGYLYYNGRYQGKPTEEKEYFYIKGTNKEIVEFLTKESVAYKSIEDSIIEKEEINLINKLIVKDGKIYISIDDLCKLTSMQSKYNERTATIEIYTAKKIIEKINEKKPQNADYSIDLSYKNSKAVLNNLLVVSSNGQYGVIDIQFNNQIGYKYKTMEFDENTTDFIVSDSNGKYGIINKDGGSKISLSYDRIYIISYKPVLYAVVKNQKYGVINEKEEVIINNEYDTFACPGDSRENTNTACIIPDIGNGEKGLVVGKDNKYGVINLNTGKFALEIEADKIYSKTDKEGEKEFYILVNKEETNLKSYIKAMNTVKYIVQ